MAKVLPDLVPGENNFVNGKLPIEPLSQEFLRKLADDAIQNKKVFETFVKLDPIIFYKYGELTEEQKKEVGGLDGAEYSDEFLEKGLVSYQSDGKGKTELYLVPNVEELYLSTNEEPKDVIDGLEAAFIGIKKEPVDFITQEELYKNEFPGDYADKYEASWTNKAGELDRPGINNDSKMVVSTDKNTGKVNKVYGVSNDEATGYPNKYFPLEV